ncbi:histidine kinase [Caulobacter sp. D5]|uniref:LytTR family DNA-binding domain-containing protein n=2 Tax=unclassified Caulobacter TaxID=2648921 RepID=UPI000D732B21|nr:LytTR family DNA-binding domain-containing protein [Caulobacter sp. D5]PXA92200.1 histidine kinase [Caulobacter sp. D5]
MTPIDGWPIGRRLAADLALLTALGLFMGVLAPWGTADLGPVGKITYWLACIVGGGVIGVAVDEVLGRRLGGFWKRLVVVTLLMTPLVTAWVSSIEGFYGADDVHMPLELWWRVWVISALVMAMRALVWRAPRRVVETRVVVEPPLPQAEAAFRRRLSARRRSARLIAVEAHDHYLKVHTDAGEELLTLRFSDALKDLAGVHGLQVHRSWWVAAEAIEGVRWRRGAGELLLAGGVNAPVSRRHAPTVRAAGWV